MTTFTRRDWNMLIGAIAESRCVPFLGAGIAPRVAPDSSTIAAGYASNFPLQDKRDLVRVAQYLAMTHTRPVAKSMLARKLREVNPPDFSQDDEPHHLLARHDLGIDLYLTTNYNNFMFEALKREPLRKPRREYCRWAQNHPRDDTIFKIDPDLHSAKPVVFHLHGYADKSESLVITEDDYLEFLVNAARNDDWLPIPVRDKLGTSLMLFLGYRLTDWDFRVLVHSVLRSHFQWDPGREHLSIQLVPEGVTRDDENQFQNLLDAVSDTLKAELKLTIYWKGCDEFMRELRVELQQQGFHV